MIEISIIIPHRNIPDLLIRCINTIPITENIETIIVDDNSNNNIVNFNLFPGRNRNNTKVIFTKEGKGAGYARNIGLNEAQGKWILFADADDFFLPNAFNIVKEYYLSNFDVIFFNTICRMSKDLNIVSGRMDFYKNALTNKDENLIRYKAPTPTLKMIKHDLLIRNKIRFEEKPVSNDLYFSTMVSYYAKHINKDFRPIMCITDRIDSLVRHTHSKKERIIRIETMYECSQILNSIGKSKYNMNPFMWYFGPKIIDIRNWLNIKYFINCLYISKYNFNFIKHLYWALKWKKK